MVYQCFKPYIKSIKHLEITNENFEVKDNILKNLDKAINIWYDPTAKPFLVELFVDKDATKYLERIPLSKTQKIVKNNDDSSTIYLEITNENEIIRKILMWIPNVKVIQPKWLKEKIESYIKEYVNSF